MNEKQIVHSLLNILHNKKTIIDIHNILLSHKCYYILTLYDNPYSKIITTKKTLNRIVTKERYAAIKPILDKLPCKYAIIKGAILSKMAYNDSYIRLSGDIDLLVKRTDAEIIKYLLLDNGFIQGRVVNDRIVPFSRNEIIYHMTTSHQSAPYLRASTSKILPVVNVDVNHSVLWGEQKDNCDMEYVFSHISEVTFEGERIQKLDPEMEFVALCLHHYKDLNSIYLLSIRGIKLHYFCDIFFYVKNNRLKKNVLLSIIKKLNVGCYIYYCLYYTNMIFESPQISDLLSILIDYKDDEILNSFGLDESERKEWHVDFFTRLFNFDFNRHLLTYLTPKDLEKIRINRSFM